jgi:hypothetical protein
MSKTRTISGAVGAAVGVALALGGGALIAVQDSHRDHDGYYSTKTLDVRAHGYAITSEDLGVDGIDGELARTVAGRIRLRVTPATGSPLFVGVGRTKDVDGYLRGVARSEVTNFDSDGISTRLKDQTGGGPEGAPAQQSFWHATTEGTGTQTLDWRPRDGDWRMVVMNSSGSSHVTAQMKVGVQTNVLLWIGLALLGAGVVSTAAGASLLLVSRKRG